MLRARSLLRLYLRVVLVVCAITYTGPDDLLGALNVITNCLLVDCVVLYALRSSSADAPGNHAVDEHCPALVVGLSRLYTVVRASGYGDESDAWVRVVMECTWCLTCLVATVMSKEAYCKWGTFHCVQNLQFLFMCLIIPAPCEDVGHFVVRALNFAALCVCLYAEMPEHECMIGARGYLLCFLPVLVVSFPLAIAFAVLSLAMVVVADFAQVQEWPRAVVGYGAAPVI